MPETKSILTNDQVRYLASVGFNLYEQGKTEDAKTMFNGLVAANDSYYGYAGLGAIALAQNPPELDVAFENLKKAEERNPDDPTVHANIGEVFLRRVKFEDAAAEFHKAFELDPEKRDAGANRARALIAALSSVAHEIEKAAVNR